jgi:early secretory antigenic target protein ESAT-6
MTIDGLRVDHSGLELAAQDMAATVRAIGDRLHRLDQELAPLRHDWSGQAQQAYLTAAAAWNAAMDEMRTLLDATGRAVLLSDSDYRAADQRGAAAFELR